MTTTPRARTAILTSVMTDLPGLPADIHSDDGATHVTVTPTQWTHAAAILGALGYRPTVTTDPIGDVVFTITADQLAA